jgi:hypothetical protein
VPTYSTKMFGASIVPFWRLDGFFKLRSSYKFASLVKVKLLSGPAQVPTLLTNPCRQIFLNRVLGR